MDPDDPPMRVLVIMNSPQSGTQANSVACQTLEKVVEQTNGNLAEIEVRVLGQIPGYQPSPGVDYIDIPASYENLLGIIVSDGWEPHVLHFIGEGVYDHTMKTGALKLTGPDGKPRPTSSNLLKKLFDEWQPRVVLLQACENAMSGTESAFMCLADELFKNRIRAVVAMQFSIANDHAGLFAAKFYEGLRQGLNVDEAVQNARQAIWVRVESKIPEFGTPVLFTYDPARIMPALEGSTNLGRPRGFEQESQVGAAGNLIGMLLKYAQEEEVNEAQWRIIVKPLYRLLVDYSVVRGSVECGVGLMTLGYWSEARESFENAVNELKRTALPAKPSPADQSLPLASRASSKSIAGAMKANIDLDSGVDQPTEFSRRLPAPGEALTDSTKAAPIGSPTKRQEQCK